MFHLFVYGTLKTNGRKFQVCSESVTNVEKAYAVGIMKDLGAFPAMMEGVGTVHGEAISMEDSVEEGVLVVLDRIEGYRPENPDSSFYTRKKITVTTESGEDLEAWAYFLEDAHNRLTIKSGIWEGGTTRYVVG